MSPRVPSADPGRLALWCAEHLGSPATAELFTSGHLSAVIGLRLADDREVVVKVRPGSPRIAACAEVQRCMFESGSPGPEPLSGPAPFGGGMATAEVYVPGGAVLPDAEHASQVSAEAFARLIRLAPRPADVPPLNPAPSWAAWNHTERGCSTHIAKRVASRSAQTNASCHGRPVSGPGPMTPNASTRPGRQSYRCPRRRLTIASAGPGSANPLSIRGYRRGCGCAWPGWPATA
jgi:hypothetical protein